MTNWLKEPVHSGFVNILSCRILFKCFNLVEVRTWTGPLQHLPYFLFLHFFCVVALLLCLVSVSSKICPSISCRTDSLTFDPGTFTAEVSADILYLVTAKHGAVHFGQL